MKITVLSAFICFQMVISAQSTVNERAIKFDPANSQNAILVGDNGMIMKTIDNGLTWNQQVSGTSIILYGVAIIDGSNSFAVGENGTILKTIDGGNSWNRIIVGVTQTLRDIAVSTSGIIEVCGDNGTIITSSDLFNRFDVTQITTSNLNSILALPNGELIAAGDNSTCLKTYDGYSWQVVTVTGETTDFKGISGVDELHMWIISRGSIIYHSVNEVEWNGVNSAPFGIMNGIHFFNATDGIIVGNSGLIIKTSDGGNSWYLPVIQNPTTRNLLDVSFSSLDEGITVGEQGEALFSADGGNTWASQAPGPNKPVAKINKSVTLSQNYPNPFNPSTNISYALPFSSSVSLKIYDMLGREVKTLVNDLQSAGNYNYRFDASNLSSGIYFYVLKAANGVNEVSKTMRMILTK